MEFWKVDKTVWMSWRFLAPPIAYLYCHSESQSLNSSKPNAESFHRHTERESVCDRMRSITLSESVLGAYSLPSPFPKPLKPSSSSCYLLPFKLRSKKLTSKLSLPNPSFVSSR